MQNKTITAFLPAFLFFCLTLYLFTLPGEKIPTIDWLDAIYGDKWIHMGLFAILLFLLGYALPKTNWATSTKLIFLLVCLFVAAMYGTAIEFIQKYFIPFRSFDIGDIAADIVGCLIGYYVAKKKFI
jgi:glycopeptide antibiotics resistance protein